VTVPGNQSGGTTFTVKAIDTGLTDGQGFYTNADGSRHIWSGTINAATTSDRVIVVDNNVVVQEASVIGTFSSPASVVSFVHMESNGDWLAYGNNVDTIDWVLRNGAVVASTDTAITPSSAELWDDVPYAQTYFLAVGNNNGDYVVGGTTSASDALANAVLVLNGQTVLSRENDPIDLNNNGSFDDDVYLRTYIDDFAFMTDTDLYMIVRLRDGGASNGCSADTDIGQALIRIPLPSTGPTCDSADFDCDGDTGTDADIEAFFACLSGNCPAAPCGNDSDFNNDGDTGTDADIEAFFRILSGGNC
jgi:hypothetical protein